uniref:Uncharacterized protein n=1 Tax=Cercocebus atys TaxID=9531 RepID=A0A2K5NEV4_CERAT
MVAAQGEPQVHPSSVLLDSSLETLTWNLLPCLLTQLWQCSMNIL